jgi:HEAT repeat protein
MRYFLLIALSVLIIGCGHKDDVAIRESNQLIAQRQYDNARAIIEKALREDPKNPKLLRQQVRYFLKTEQVPFSVATYNKLQEVAPRDNVLFQALSDDDPVVRITAVRAFGQIKSPDSLAALIKASEDHDKSIRLAVIQSLIQLGNSNAIPALQKLLKDEDWYVRGNAARALGQIGNADCVTELFKCLTDNDPYVHKSVKQALWHLATPANQSAYLVALNSPDTATRSCAALILAVSDSKDASPVLIAELNNANNPDLAEIIQALTKIKDPAALPGLRQLATNANSDVKLHAILALGEYKDKAAVGLLKGIQKDPKSSAEIRTACTVALSKIAQ